MQGKKQKNTHRVQTPANIDIHANVSGYPIQGFPCIGLINRSACPVVAIFP